MNTTDDFSLVGRASQRHYYDEACDPEFEVTRPHGCGQLYQFLITHKFQTGLALLGLELAGKTVLEVCCGSGMLAEELARRGARVIGIDFSPAAVARAQERARRYGFAARFLVADAEHLPFLNHSFDVVAVHDGLHHLDDPYRAIREMARIAREGVLILEPAQAGLTRLAVRLGVAEGEWRKVYRRGRDGTEIHYFEHRRTGKVWGIKVK